MSLEKAYITRFRQGIVGTCSRWGSPACSRVLPTSHSPRLPPPFPQSLPKSRGARNASHTPFYSPKSQYKRIPNAVKKSDNWTRTPPNAVLRNTAPNPSPSPELDAARLRPEQEGGVQRQHGHGPRHVGHADAAGCCFLAEEGEPVCG